MARVTVQNRDVCFRDIKKCIECFVPERRQSEWSWNFIFDVRELRTSLSWLLGTNMKNGMYLVRQRLFDSRIQHVGGNTIFHVSLKSNSWAHVVPASLSIKDNSPPPPTCLSSAACRDRWGVRPVQSVCFCSTQIDFPPNYKAKWGSLACHLLLCFPPVVRRALFAPTWCPTHLRSLHFQLPSLSFGWQPARLKNRKDIFLYNVTILARI